ncbi:MAG: hypothetical protein FWB86_11200 [Treponema sp.]|nr:hypothetical protein [Treponema sp.]MCL2252454.1 hypothetical protein [Treponema sp.]
MKKISALIVLFTIVLGCTGTPNNVTSGSNELDLAIRDASDYLNNSIPNGNIIVILNIQSDSTNLSNYIIDELIANAVNDRIFKVVDRQQLDLIRSEQNFQFSGEVDDNMALSIGKFFGAQTIVSGRFSEVAEHYRMTIRALDVQTAQVQGQYNRNIPASQTLTALMRNSGGIAATNQNNTSRVTNNITTTASSNRIPIDPSPEGALNISNVATWNSAINRIRNGGNDQSYILHVAGNISVPLPPNNENIFGSVTGLTVTIQGSGSLSPSTNGSLIQIGSRQTVIASGNIALRGRSGNNKSIIRIMDSGVFRMEGNSSVTGNVNSGIGGGIFVESGGRFIMQDNASVTNNRSSNWAGGVYIAPRGNFTMQGGTISGNTGSWGGGLLVGNNATFIMQGGKISGNSGMPGGGVHTRGTFTMQDGIISGNNSRGEGGGVYVATGTFTKTGGIIYGNDAGQSLDNNASQRGHALSINSNPARWRNATAGRDDNTSGYGFWFND